MSDEKILSGEEVQALLSGVSSGAIETGAGVMPAGEVEPFDLGALDRVAGGVPPALGALYGRFARDLGSRLGATVRRPVSLSLDSLRCLRYADYLGSLAGAVSLHTFEADPLRGSGLFALDAPLVYTFVDLFFGGGGQLPGELERTSFTPAEQRMADVLLRMAIDDLAHAWTEVAALEFTLTGRDDDPSRIAIAAPSEPVVVSVFSVALNDAVGQLHVVMPKAMFAPVTALLEASGHGDLDDRDRFMTAVRDELKDTRVELSATLCEARLALRDLVRLSPGDVIPIELPDHIAVVAGRTPVLVGTFGVSRGINAVKVIERIPVAEPTN